MTTSAQARSRDAPPLPRGGLARRSATPLPSRLDPVRPLCHRGVFGVGVGGLRWRWEPNVTPLAQARLTCPYRAFPAPSPRTRPGPNPPSAHRLAVRTGRDTTVRAALGHILSPRTKSVCPLHAWRALSSGAPSQFGGSSPLRMRSLPPPSPHTCCSHTACSSHHARCSHHACCSS
eukprot:scaffold5986_cov128-Isochrysis_galbana.AAC.11